MNLYLKLSTRPYIFSQITGVSLQEFASILKKLRPIWRRKHLKKKKNRRTAIRCREFGESPPLYPYILPHLHYPAFHKFLLWRR